MTRPGHAYAAVALLALFLADTTAIPQPAATGASAAASGPTDAPVVPPCRLCAEDPGVPVRRLTVQDAYAIGNAYARRNRDTLARIDSLLAAGAFGDAVGAGARDAAHRMARLLTVNAYSYMVDFATRRDSVFEASEADLAPAFAAFSDPGVVPIARLRRARMGLGRMCAHYDLEQELVTETVLGGQRLRARITDVSISGRMQRVLVMDLPTGLHDLVEVYIGPHVSIEVERLHRPGPPAPYEMYALDSIQGVWVHKAGTHKPQAFVFWVTPRDVRRSALPETPLVGVRIYVPRLRLRLPFILPDIRFEDLRAVDLPQPILELGYLRDGRYPGWLEPSKLRGFKGWSGIGPLPPEVRQRFPDL